MTRALVMASLAALVACGSSATGPVALDCPTYCAAIQAACTMGNQQYGDQGTCELACPAFAVGTSGDTAGDTLGCRIHESRLAAAGPAAASEHCRRAGPGGDGVCGENCDGYCDLAMTFCTADKDARIYDSRAACLADCRGHGPSAKYTAASPGATDMGNQVACLLFHGVLASLSPGMHCLPHLAPTAPICQ